MLLVYEVYIRSCRISIINRMAEVLFFRRFGSSPVFKDIWLHSLGF